MQELVFITDTKIDQKQNNDEANKIPFSISDTNDTDKVLSNLKDSAIYVVDAESINISYIKFYSQLLFKYLYALDRLKVIFYSSKTKEELITNDPKSYVIKLLPFIQTDPSLNLIDEVIKEITIRNKNGWPLFNQASFNLLTGWALGGFKSITSNDALETSPIVCIVDDQIDEWKLTYEAIFDESKVRVKQLKYNREKGDDSFDLEKISNNKYLLNGADLIISDFYLEEEHEPENWLSQEELSSKSGFKFYKEISGDKNITGKNSGVPFMVHSTSNKVPYFKFLNDNGIEDWCVKDSSTINDSNKNQLNYYSLFKSQVEHYVSNGNSLRYRQIKVIWNIIMTFSKPEKLEILWWNEDSDFIIKEFKNATYDIKSFLSNKRYYVKEMGIDNEAYISSSVIGNLGKLLEWWLSKVERPRTNFLFNALKQIRNEAAHYRENNLSIDDAIFYLKVFVSLFDRYKVKIKSKEKEIEDHLKLVDEESLFSNEIGSGTYPSYLVKYYQEKSKHKPEIKFKSGLIIYYLQIYNSRATANYQFEANKQINQMLETRIKDIVASLNDADSKKLIHDIVKHKNPIKKKSNDTIKLRELIAENLSEHNNKLAVKIKEIGTYRKAYLVNA